MLTVCVIGDKSRYQFLRILALKKGLATDNAVLFSTEKLSLSNIKIYRTKDEIPKEEKEFEGFTSRFIPFNTELLFPKNGNEIAFCTLCSLILYFDEFPFRSESELKLLNEIVSAMSLPKIKVVLFADKRRMLSSDISNEEEALNVAETDYRENGFNVIRYKTEENPTSLIINNPYNVKRFTNYNYRQRLVKAEENVGNLDAYYEYRYVLDMEPFVENPNILENFVSFRPTLSGKKVYDEYLKAAIKYFFENDENNNKLSHFISEVINDLIDDTNIRSLCCTEDFLENLKNEFKIFLDNEKKHEPVVENFAGGKSDYIRYLNKTHIDIKFKKNCIDFFKLCMKSYIKNRLTLRLAKLKELLNENN